MFWKRRRKKQNVTVDIESIAISKDSFLDAAVITVFDNETKSYSCSDFSTSSDCGSGSSGGGD
jgi:hypothetical protein